MSGVETCLTACDLPILYITTVVSFVCISFEGDRLVMEFDKRWLFDSSVLEKQVSSQLQIITFIISVNSLVYEI